MRSGEPHHPALEVFERAAGFWQEGDAQMDTPRRPSASGPLTSSARERSSRISQRRACLNGSAASTLRTALRIPRGRRRCVHKGRERPAMRANF
jgi:hypothetical protein